MPSPLLMPHYVLPVNWRLASLPEPSNHAVGRARPISLGGIGALWLLAYAPSVWMLGMFIVCFGGMLGARGPLISTIAAQFSSTVAIKARVRTPSFSSAHRLTVST